MDKKYTPWIGVLTIIMISCYSIYLSLGKIQMLRWGSFTITPMNSSFVLQDDLLRAHTYSLHSYYENAQQSAIQTINFSSLLSVIFTNTLSFPLTLNQTNIGSSTINTKDNILMWDQTISPRNIGSSDYKYVIEFSPEDHVYVNGDDISVGSFHLESSFSAGTTFKLINDQLSEGIEFSLPDRTQAHINWAQHEVIISLSDSMQIPMYHIQQSFKRIPAIPI
ncbi:hypothetical protein HGA91_03015 [candidate division WWE3 bacterium]|nr:hypothetical protein [candidate division WWE3 bacterium]